MFNKAFQGKRVFITGNTGFVGSWLTILLRGLGAEVIGYSLEPPTVRNLYTRASLEEKITQISGDVRNMAFIAQSLVRYQPDYIFHLAAQPSSIVAMQDPVETFEVNVMGSLALMEAIRQANLETTVIMATSDKVYEDQDWAYGYRENDRLGGSDPLSASKTATEVAVNAFSQTYFSRSDAKVRIATARSGHVIGGGDWGERRIVPDCIRAFSAGENVVVHNPKMIRPWQHILEPLTGYLWLAAVLAHREDFAGAWNLGPMMTSHKSVRIVVERILSEWGNTDCTWEDASDGIEASLYPDPTLIKLNIEKVQEQLNWRPVWNFRQAITRTVDWYKDDLKTNEDSVIYQLCESDIEAYIGDASAMRLPYTR